MLDSRKSSFDFSKISRKLSTSSRGHSQGDRGSRRMSRHSLIDMTFSPQKGEPIQLKFYERSKSILKQRKSVDSIEMQTILENSKKKKLTRNSEIVATRTLESQLRQMLDELDRDNLETLNFE